MKSSKWIIALIALTLIVGCEKSNEQKVEDAADEMGKDVERLKLPGE